MKIIDAHVHIFPDKIAAAAVNATADFYEGSRRELKDPPPADYNTGKGTVTDILEKNTEAGITRSVVFSTATTPKQVESINSFIARECAAHPEFIGAGTMHIDYPDFEREVLRMKALGLRGLKLHPDIQALRVDDDRLFPLYECMQAEGLFLVLHAGDRRYDYSSPRRIERVAKAFPKLKINAAHFGGFSEWEEAMARLVLPNVYVDTSSTVGFGGLDAARKALKVFDPTHIFFGSDYPMWTPAAELKRLELLNIPDALLPAILAENFEAFLAT